MKMTIISSNNETGTVERQYGSWIIVKFDNSYLLDSEISGSQYNIYESFNDYAAGRAAEIVSTLRAAKNYVDINS